MNNPQKLTHLTPPGLPKPVALYSYGVKVKPGASLIFVSGLGPVDDEGKGLVGFDIYTQTCRVMDRIKKVLEEAGATMDDIVNMRVELADIENWEGCCKAYSKYFKTPPAAVLESVSGFTYGPGQLVEIEVMAAV